MLTHFLELVSTLFYLLMRCCIRFLYISDRTAKVWDLETGEELLTLDGHPNNVGCVRYCEETSLAYTVSTYFVKVWDLRQGNCCITTVM